MKSEIIAENQIDEIKSNLKARNFRNEFDNFGKVIFIQMQPKNNNDLGAFIIK